MNFINKLKEFKEVGKKTVYSLLSKVYGFGKSVVKFIIANLKIASNTPIKNLSKNKLNRLAFFLLKNYIVTGKKLKSYKERILTKLSELPIFRNFPFKPPFPFGSQACTLKVLNT